MLYRAGANTPSALAVKSAESVAMNRVPHQFDWPSR